MSNPEQLNNVLCCNQPASIMPDKNADGIDGFGIWCSECGHAIHRQTREDAIKVFLEGVKTPPSQPPKQVNNRPQSQGATNMQQQNSLVPSRNNIAKIFEPRRDQLSLEVMPILSNSGSMFDRLMTNNTEKYPLTLIKGFDKVFASDVGRASLIHEIEEAIIMGAELGKMGDIVPFGEICLFIPSVEACKFALTNGVNAPFLDFNIKCEYEGDEFESSMKDGNYSVNILKEGEKETVVNVYVWGTLSKTGQTIGEKYSSKRLLEKAETSSKPYQKYLKYKNAYEFQKAEGKTEIDRNGRESFKYYESAKSDDPYFDKSVAYFKQAEDNGQLKSDAKGDYAVQSIPKKAGGTFDKKIYRYEVEGGTVATTMYLDELKNPYAGANQPEMLKKTAGKSFARPFLKVRNSEAAMHEVRTQKQGVDRAMDMGDEQFKNVEGVVE